MRRDISDRVEDENLRRQWELCFTQTKRGISIVDPESGLLISLNPALAEMHGGTVGDFLGKPLASLFTQESASLIPAVAEEAHKTGYIEYESDHVRLDGSVFAVRAEVMAARDSKGELLYRVGWYEDLTNERLAARESAAVQREFEIAFEGAPNGIAIVDLDGRFLRPNLKLCELMGYSREELQALTFQEITHPEDLEIDLAEADRLFRGEITSYEIEKRYFTKQGHIIWVLLGGALVRDDDGEPLHFIAQIQDISKRKLMEIELHELANRDPVTSLWNRRRFEDEFERQVSRCRRYGEQAALILLDLDGFKAVNDKGGHKTGDRLLRSVGRQLTRSARESDVVARIGGDEFAVILVNVDEAQAASVAEKLRDCVRKAGPTSEVTASIGVTHLNGSASNNTASFVSADAAMYKAKAQGGDRVVQSTQAAGRRS